MIGNGTFRASRFLLAGLLAVALAPSGVRAQDSTIKIGAVLPVTGK